MTRICMTGGKGKIGSHLSKFGIEDLGVDITNLDSLYDSVSKHKPDIIVHLAAKSRVAWCEAPENSETVVHVNFQGTFNVLAAAEKYGAQVVMLSSDHVFDGNRLFFTSYTEKSTPNPINFYGYSKMVAEALQEGFENFKIIRTSYLFDDERLKQETTKSQPTFIFRSFMHIDQFVFCLQMYLKNYESMPKLLHISGSKTVSWHKMISDYLSRKDVPYHTKDINPDGVPRPLRAGLRTVYRGLLPSFSYLDGFGKG